MPQCRQLLFILLTPLWILLTFACDNGSPTELTKETLELTRLSGNNQQGVQGDTLSTAFTVLVTNNNGKAVPGREIHFIILEGEGSLSVEKTNTDDNGQASTTLILGNQQGKVTVEAKISGTSISALFTAFVEINKPYSIEIAGGNGQVACPGETLPDPLRVLVKDDRGRSFEGAVVTFSIEEGTGSLSALSDTSSAFGTAQTILTLGDNVGITKVMAAIEGVDSQNTVTFTANALPPTIEIAGGNDQRGDPGDELQITVHVRNANNQPIVETLINFTIESGQGELSVLSDITNNQGIAQTTLTLGESIGTTKVIASVQKGMITKSATLTVISIYSHDSYDNQSVILNSPIKYQYTGDHPTFSWQSVENIDKYYLILMGSKIGGIIWINEIANSDTSVKYSGELELLNGYTYFWYIVAISQIDTIAISDIGAFVTNFE